MKLTILTERAQCLENMLFIVRLAISMRLVRIHSMIGLFWSMSMAKHVLLIGLAHCMSMEICVLTFGLAASKYGA